MAPGNAPTVVDHAPVTAWAVRTPAALGPPEEKRQDEPQAADDHENDANVVDVEPVLIRADGHREVENGPDSQQKNAHSNARHEIRTSSLSIGLDDEKRSQSAGLSNLSVTN